MSSKTMLKGLTINKTWKAYNGYTLFTSLGQNKATLISMSGRVMHEWSIPDMSILFADLQPNGNLICSCHLPDGPLADLECASGMLMEIDWEGNVVWKYKDPYMHHGFYRMKNGNILILKWAKVQKDLSSKVCGGYPGSERDGVMWGDVIQEITPNGKIVWEWVSFKHLSPENDIICPVCGRDQWGNANSCVEMADGNIAVCFRRLNIICGIDKVTGKIDWRWGLHEISHPSYITLTENGNPLLFDNGFHGEGIHHPYSRIMELDPKTRKVIWTYRDKDNDNIGFYSGFMSSCQRLPNGNTLIVESNTGRIFEITVGGEIIWEFRNPAYAEFADYGNNNVVPRAVRYGCDYCGLKGNKELKLGKFIQTQSDIERNKKKETTKAIENKPITEETKAGDSQKKDVESRLAHLGY